MERAPDEHNLVGNVSFYGSQNVRANARAFDHGDGAFDDDALTGKSLVEWPGSRLFAVGVPFG